MNDVNEHEACRLGHQIKELAERPLQDNPTNVLARMSHTDE